MEKSEPPSLRLLLILTLNMVYSQQSGNRLAISIIVHPSGTMQPIHLLFQIYRQQMVHVQLLPTLQVQFLSQQVHLYSFRMPHLMVHQVYMLLIQLFQLVVVQTHSCIRLVIHSQEPLDQSMIRTTQPCLSVEHLLQTEQQFQYQPIHLQGQVSHSIQHSHMAWLWEMKFL